MHWTCSKNIKKQSTNKCYKSFMKEYLNTKNWSLASNNGWGKEREWEEGVQGSREAPHGKTFES
jgi:hypothetical protein